MRIMIGDTVVHNDTRKVGVVERRAGAFLTLCYPDEGNRREQVPRREVRPLAEAMREARERGTRFRSLSLAGGAKIYQLVAAFGYSTEYRLRANSLDKVIQQLWRAGLWIPTLSEGWTRDDDFRLELREEQPSEADQEAREGDTAADSPPPDQVEVAIPEPFWPTALGLDPNLEVAFLRALSDGAPILCVLTPPDDRQTQAWLQPTWEGLVGWAYRLAQRFNQETVVQNAAPEVQVGPGALLHTYLKPSVLNSELPRLRNERHCLNLVTLNNESESPVEFLRLKAVWPGPIFEFTPQETLGSKNGSDDARAILECLSLVAGFPPQDIRDGSRSLHALLWSREASAQVLARASAKIGCLLASGEWTKFRGSNESAMALAMKAHLATWVRKGTPDAEIEFEKREILETESQGDRHKVCRVDMVVKNTCRFEVETLVGSGPIERFYHQKVFSRATKDGLPLRLVLPAEAVLFIGPYLSDLAAHLEDRAGCLLLPGSNGGFLKVKKQVMNDVEVVTRIPPEVGPRGKEPTEPPLDRAVRLRDIAGYKEVVSTIEDRIIWPEKHRRALSRTSRSSGILFFGPPGCGKSRLARAIAGELEREVRLLGPSDLRGPYIGWGQIMIREQFDWVAEHERRILVVDELDAVARSRRQHGDMHSDEKADVNELLVQLDRVSRLRRLVIGTTNYIDSLDEAVLRSGRFGLFIPVPPPDLEEGVAILKFYLALLVRDGDGPGDTQVRFPGDAELCSLLKPLYAENARDGVCFCGADLEEAANQSYFRCLRKLHETDGEDQRSVTVPIGASDLSESLREVRRSIHSESLEQFKTDTARYCGSTVAERCVGRLGVN